MAPTRIPPADLVEAEGLEDWRYVLNALRGAFTPGSFEAAGALVAAIAAEADRRDHHPHLALGYPGTVTVVLTTHSAGGVTGLDVDLARTISSLARDAGATADPSVATALELAIDTTDPDAIRPFWAAVLAYREVDPRVLVDPAGLRPSIWFQEMDPPRSDRNRIHLDIDVPHEEAEARVAAALEAGGRLVDGTHARAWWVLADAEGNEVCVCTWQDRD